MTEGVTLASLARDVSRLDREVATRPHQRQVDDIRRDVEKLEGKLDRIITTQLANQRTAILQLVGIIVTLAIAAYGALS